MKIKLLLIILLCAIGSFGQNTSWKVDYKKSRSFIENLGQFDYLETDETGKIEYAVDFGSTRILFSKSGILYQFTEIVKVPKAERTKLTSGDIKTIEEYKKYEKSLHGKYSFRQDNTFMQWENSNIEKSIMGLNKTSDYHSYSYLDKDLGEHISKSLIPGYEKLIYKNIYPNIDAEFVVHPESGIKYSFIVHPNADASVISMLYDKDIQLLAGKIHIPTKFGDIIDHEPLSFYDTQKDFIINSKYKLDGNRIRFQLGNYDKTKTLVIDPWVQTPTFPTNWECVWECEKDAVGNVYIIGGIMPLQLIKYSPAGALQWTFNTPYDTTGGAWLGAFATDNQGNSYISNGSSAKILKVNTNGTQVWSNNNPGGFTIAAEFWTISFNCDQTKLVVGGTGGTGLNILPYMYQVDMSTGNTTSSVQVAGGVLIPTSEVRSITACGNNRYYYLTHDSLGYINDNLSACGGLGQSSVRYSNGQTLDYKCENFRVSSSNSGISALKSFENFLYYNRGDRLEKRDFFSGNLILNVPIPGGGLITTTTIPFPITSTQVHNSGIDIDVCGNIYIGSTTGVYKFDQSLTQTGFFPTSFSVYDVHVSTAGDIIACGSTGNSGSTSRTGGIQSFAGGACAPQAIICCDATFCNPGLLCVSDAPVSLTASSAGGTWSGTGVNASGVFNPATAGAGNHDITYTLPCGSETQTISVSACQALTLCQEANGTLTVSNGTGPYIWEQTTSTTTTVTNQAQCTACGGTWLLIQCSVPSCSSTGYAQFATGTNATPTTNFPIRVTDSQGNEIIINSLTGIASCSANPCGTITVTSSGVTSASCSTGGSATVSASGGTGPYTYNWMPGNLNGASQTNLTAGTYTVTATDAASCTGTTTVTINSSGAVSLAISNQTNVACNGQSTGSATVSASGGTAPYTYTWSPGNLNGATQSNLAAGSYTVTASDAANCSSNVTVTITAPSALTTNTSTTPANCGIANGSATVQAQGGTSPYTYAWSPSGGNAATANNLNSGAYTVLVTDASGCTKTNNVNVPANGGPTLTIANQTNVGCSGAPTGSATITVQGGTAPYTYAWSPTGGNTASASNLSAGTYTLSVTDASNCVVSISVTITAANGPSVTIGNVTNVSCQGANNGSATANASGGTAPYSYAWSPSGGNAATASNLSAGTYTVTVTDASACTSTATTTISAGNSINLVETITPENCGADDGQINVVATGGNGNLTYTWTPNVSTTATATNLSSGSYSLTVSDGNGCSTTEQYTVGQVGGINVDVIPSVTTIFEGESVSILASGAVTYVWTPTNGLSCTTCPDPVASPSTTTTYVVTGTDANGCSGTDSVKIIVKPICGEVMVPTIFSPNGDNHNDFECVIGNCIVELEFSIYNRWGERVFFTDDQTICWDGTFKGKKVNSGTFVYKIYARIYDGSTFTENGNITVVE